MHCPIHFTLFDTKDAWLLEGAGGGGLGGDSAYESGGDARRLA